MAKLYIFDIKHVDAVEVDYRHLQHDIIKVTCVTLQALALSHASFRSKPCDSSMLTMAAKRVSSVSNGSATQLCKNTETTISHPHLGEWLPDLSNQDSQCKMVGKLQQGLVAVGTMMCVYVGYVALS